MTGFPPVRLVQFNPLVGDVAGNRARIEAHLAASPEPAVWIFPELALCGYPPEDLLLRDDFLERVEQALKALAQACGPHWLIVGAPVREGGALRNAAVVLHRGERRGCACKRLLPQYDVFDEQRYFEAGRQACVVEVAGRSLGLLICEDLWQPQVAAELAAAGAEALACLNASPFDAEKMERRLEVACARACEVRLPVWYVNQIGGQDELVFDGASFALDAAGRRMAQAPAFAEAVLEITAAEDDWHGAPMVPDLDADAALYEALVLGIRDYVGKHAAAGALVGLSGGIDSALTLVLAEAALGAERLEAVLMPSRYTSEASVEDARTLCGRLGAAARELPIEPAFEALLATLGPEAAEHDLVRQNLQARIRGQLLMALSNRSGKLLLTTGNKSEMAVGYATLYGDMAGGFAPLKDVYKTRVYELARFCNRTGPLIPERILERPPSAELKEDQKDTDSLPDYAELDQVLRMFVEEDCAVEDIVASGLDAVMVQEVAARVLGSEHKRRQAPPGVKVTARAFGRDRRYPITSGYKA